VIAIYNGRAIENRIKEGKNTLRWDKTSCHWFAANQARLLVGCLAYNLLHMIRDTAFWGQSVRPSIDAIIRRLVKVGARWSTIPRGAWRYSTLLRLILLPGAIAFYAPEPLNSGRRKASCKPRGWRSVLKLPKSVLPGYLLHVRLGNCMVLRALGAQRKFCGQKSDSNVQFGSIAQKLMLFRINWGSD
jgi:hypothetical protein